MRRRYSQFVLLLGPDAVVDQRLGVNGRTQGQAVAVGAVGAHRLVEKLQKQERKEGKAGQSGQSDVGAWIIAQMVVEPHSAEN